MNNLSKNSPFSESSGFMGLGPGLEQQPEVSSKAEENIGSACLDPQVGNL